ncbi:MAG: NADPH-dependent 2,4-dienoyl-CoA reductase [Neisseriaceae bacterium]|nr:NADPH-dependent 2,4-dienoyl-CoA reductase [Neisseriaceae bacterium]MBP6863607.1 NADPH-dependent 2,4-dienoyl-CoA reductase [Neisseriaceae bacterium]
MPQAYPLLAQPITLANQVIRNRIIMGSMHTGLEEAPNGFERLAAFYGARAQGGVGLIITGGISPNDAGMTMPHAAKLSDASEVAQHQQVTAAVHQHGAKICMQLLHTGRYAMHPNAVAPSAIQAPINPVRPKALSTAEVKQTVQDYIHSATLAQQAGYDGVEVMGSEGYLINQFIAPATNERTDEYGGSLANRHRLAEEIVAGIRAACGPDFIIVFRISLLDLVPNGSTWAENEQLAEKIIAAGADVFNTGIGWHEARVPTIATMVPRAAFIDATAKLKAVSSIPVVATNRINMPDVAEAILGQGQADMVCLARPFLADANWANKAFAQQDSLINTCIACNQACLDHIFQGKATSCLVNPFACEETRLQLHPAEQKKTIAVVGAGPAGMAFAITAAERGHAVTLFDQQAQIGGQLNIAKTIPGKPEFNETLRYYDAMLKQHQVTVKLEHTVKPEDVQGFDEVVVATGIKPRSIELDGLPHPKVLSYLDVLQAKQPIGQRVAIIGTGGIGFDMAEYLSQNGADSALDKDLFLQEWAVDATLAAPGGLSSKPKLPQSARDIWLLQRRSGSVGKTLGKTTGWIHRTTLKLRGVNMLSDVAYEKVDDAGLHIKVGEEAHVLPVDQVIVCAGQVPNQAFADALQHPSVHVIGGAHDAKALDAKLAIRAGTKLALSI